MPPIARSVFAQEELNVSLNKGMGQLLDSLRTSADQLLGEIKEFDPLPIYKPKEEAAFVCAMKPKFKKLAAVADKLETLLGTIQQESTDLGIEANKILPSIHFANSEVKRILTTCCINTAARILTSKAAAHSSGSLSQSVDSTLDFARQNGLTLPKEIIESLRNCQDKLKAAAASKKSAVAPKK